MSKEDKMKNARWVTICFFWLIITACTGPYQQESAPPTNDVILHNAALLLQEEGLLAEAEKIEVAAKLIAESRIKKEGSVYLGFVPDQQLREYSVQLKKIGRTESAQKLEQYAEECYQNNLRGFLYQRSQ